ncbi:MAG: DUF4912 domain-containing protein [Methylococcales bacterium]|nr:DUF4912 domain-containing protein [Methylococcales bacterium]
MEIDSQYFSKNSFQTPSQKGMLSEISNIISQDYAPISPVDNKSSNTELALTRSELLEVSQNICLYYAPKFPANTQKLVLIPVDRQHIYACWNLGSDQDHLLAKSMMDKQLMLSIYPQQRTEQQKPQAVFEMAINNLQAQQKIRLPVSETAIHYFASIAEKGFSPLLESTEIKPFHKAEGLDDKENTRNFKARIDRKRDSVMTINKNSLNIRPISVKSHYASSHQAAKGLKQ